MADEDEVIETPEETEKPEAEKLEGEKPEGEKPAEPEIPTFDDSEEQPQDSSVIRELRNRYKETAKRARELERQVRERDEQLQKFGPKKIEVGQKPTLEQFDYDADKFEAEYDAWVRRKAAAEAEVRRKQEAEENERKTWQQKLERYAQTKQSLSLPDYDEAEEMVTGALDQTQQGVLLHAFDDPSKLIYALGKSPERLAELAGIRDPIRFAAAAAKLESQVKTSPRKPPAPESVLRGGKPVNPDAMLDQLEKEAERYGDRTKLIAYKRKLKAK